MILLDYTNLPIKTLHVISISRLKGGLYSPTIYVTKFYFALVLETFKFDIWDTKLLKELQILALIHIYYLQKIYVKIIEFKELFIVQWLAIYSSATKPPMYGLCGTPIHTLHTLHGQILPAIHVAG